MISSRTWRRLVMAAALCALPATVPAAPGGPGAGAPAKLKPAEPKGGGDPKLAFERYTLPNGLEVILTPDKRVPIVAVNLWYHVGSGHEVYGRSGFAHLFEHMVFQGSKNVGSDKHFEVLRKIGGDSINGTTNSDRTNYFEVVPSNQLELALWLESDRMGFLLDRPGLQETFDGQRDVVKNERRQRIENRPMGLVNRVTIEALYPDGHPYHHEVIGSMEDLSRASLDDVRGFFRRYYVPNNASLVLSGDFEPARAKALIEQYFGPIPAGPPIPRTPPAPVSLRAEKRIALEAKVQQPQLFMDFLTPKNLTEGDHAMDVVAQNLAGGKASRLYRKLVYDLQIAQSVTASQQSQMYQSVFEISATPLQGHTLEEIVKVIDEELENLRTKPVEARELDRAKNQLEFDLLRSLEPLLARAERLQIYNLETGDPGYLARDLTATRAVDAAAVQAAAAQFLRQDGRLIVTVVPNPDAPIMGRVKPQ